MSDIHLKSIADSLAGIHSELTAIRVALEAKPAKQAKAAKMKRTIATGLDFDFGPDPDQYGT